MNTKTKETLLTNWHPLRWFALGAGLFFLLQAVLHWDWLTGLFGGFFLFQALTNTGCLGGQSCTVPDQKSKIPDAEEIHNVEYTTITND